MIHHLCFIACESGKHDENCVEDCGNCKSGDVCDRVTGHCPDGCQAGWWTDMCKEGKSYQNIKVVCVLLYLIWTPLLYITLHVYAFKIFQKLNHRNKLYFIEI